MYIAGLTIEQMAEIESVKQDYRNHDMINWNMGQVTNIDNFIANIVRIVKPV